MVDPRQTELLQAKELLAFAAASDRQGGRGSNKINYRAVKGHFFTSSHRQKKSLAFFFSLYGYV